MIAILSKPTQVKFAWLILAFTLLCIAWCANPWQLYFLNDDFIHIPMAYDGTIGHHRGLRYINDFSLYTDSLLSKENATGYHITNLFLHVANIILSIFLLQKIAASLGHPLRTSVVLLMAGLFGIYAFHSEALFWILCRTASLSFLFNALSWLCFFKALKQRWWILPMVVFFLLGMFTYESLWVFPFWLLAWYWLLRKTDPQKIKAKLPIGIIWVLFIAYFPLRLHISGQLLGTYEANDIQKFHSLSILVKTTKLFARSFLPPISNSVVFVILFLLVITGLIVIGIKLWRQKKADRLFWFFLIAWLLSYFPYISLGVSVTGYESERYLYYPSFFLCALVVYVLLLLYRLHTYKLLFYLSLVFLYQLFFLIKASVAFKAVSSYSKNGIQAIQQVPLNKKIIIKNLPVYSNGLPVFNYGFMDAVEWMAPGRDSADIVVLNKTNFQKKTILNNRDSSGIMADTITFLGK